MKGLDVPRCVALTEQLRDAFCELSKSMADAIDVVLPIVVYTVKRHAIQDLDIPESDIRQVQMRDGSWGVQLKNWRWVAADPYGNEATS